MSRKKRKERQFKTNFKENNHLQVITGGQLETIQRSKEVRIVPRNFKQDDLLELLQDDTKHIVFATGPAGTVADFGINSDSICELSLPSSFDHGWGLG